MSDNYFEISRVFDAPCERVFAACSEAEQVSQWSKITGHSITKCEIDFRVGGKWIQCMQSPSGNEMCIGGEHLEITENETFSHTEHICDADGNVLDPKEVGMEWPKYTEVRLKFSKVDEGKTKLTIRHGELPDSSMRDHAEQVWTQSLGNLDAFLSAD